MIPKLPNPQEVKGLLAPCLEAARTAQALVWRPSSGPGWGLGRSGSHAAEVELASSLRAEMEARMLALSREREWQEYCWNSVAYYAVMV